MIVGVDCGMRKLHCVVLHDDGQWAKGFEFISKERESSKASQELAEEFDYLLKSCKHLGTCVLIEAPIYLQNALTSFGIAATINKAEYVAQKHYIPVRQISNKTWKKVVVGSGNSTKEQIMTFAKEKWGDVVTVQDLADAGCIALYGVIERQKEES